MQANPRLASNVNVSDLLGGVVGTTGDSSAVLESDPPPTSTPPSPQATPASSAAASAPAAEAPEGAPSEADLEEESVGDVPIPSEESDVLPAEAQSLGLNQDEWAAVQDARGRLRNISDPNQRSLAAEAAYEELQDEHGSLGNLNVSDLIQSSAAIKQIDRSKYS